MTKLRFTFSLLFLIFISFNIFNSKNIKIDASSDSLILQNDQTFKNFEYYNKIFPSKNFLVLAIKGNKKIDEEYIDNIKIITKELKKLKEIESIFSILNAPIFLINSTTISELADKKISNLNNTKIELDLILEEFSTSPILKNQIINEKKDVSSIIIYINENNDFNKIKNKYKNAINNNDKIIKEYKIAKIKNYEKKELLIENIRKIINKQNNQYTYFLGGIDMITSDTISFIKNDILVFSFAVIFFIIIILFIIFRDIKWVILPLVTTLYSVLTMTGIIGFLEWEITAISSNFISLMLILSISMNIHIINHYRALNNVKISNGKKIKKTFLVMFWPCLYTSLTTIVAFISLLFSNIKPLIDFGNVMILALLVIFSISFTLLPLLISYFPSNNIKKLYNFNILNNFYYYAKKNILSIISINIFIFFISIYGIYNLNVENSFINYFKSNTQIYKGMKLIDQELGGTTPIDIIVEFKKKNEEFDIKINSSDETNDDLLELEGELEFSDDLFEDLESNEIWFTKEKLQTIKKIHEFLESKNEVGKVLSINSLIEMGNLINKEPLSIFELSILYNEIPSNYKESLIDPYLSTEENMVKISARIKDSNEIKRDELIKEIRNYINYEFTNIKKFEVNGLLVLYNNLLQSLFSSQIKSFGIILISIFIMFIVLFRSIKLSVVGMIPNIIASSFILGLIGLLKIPLDIMTITIAAITIGIAVDNTIHYIYKVKINNKLMDKSNEVIKDSHQNVGKAVLTTSITIAFGFSVLSLSSFIPTILFGIFTALAMIIAMIGVLITLPAILLKIKI